MPMLLQPYNPDWENHFQQIKQELDVALAGLDYRIEHVGSTSIPGIAAKPIIDLDIIYPTGGDFARINAALQTIGYFHNGDQGIPEREAFKRVEGQADPVLDQIVHHLYVCPAHSKALARHLLMRDHMCKHPAARSAYEKLKYEVAERAHQDRKVYAELKELTVNDLIDSIIEIEAKAQAED